MMGFFFYMIFLTPLFFFVDLFIFQYSFLLIGLFIIFMYMGDFYCNLGYNLGFDFISFGLLLLSFIIISVMILCGCSSLNYSFFFVLINYFILFIMFIFFCCLSIFYFYLFFEFSLIPMVFLILGWGYQPERLLSMLYLFFYTMFGSLPLLFVIFYIYCYNFTLFFDLICLSNFGLFMHFFLIFGFMIKFPMFMVHFWLPKAHVQAPVFGSMILAGVMLSIGGYGLIRIFFLIDDCILSYGYFWYSLSIYGSMFVGLLCFFQCDLSSLIAYSSISHMGLCIIGLLSLTSWGVMGSYFLMLSHGLCSSCLFLISSYYYNRLHSRSFFLSSGLFSFIPSLSPFWLSMCCFNMGCPPSLNFFSEIMILNSMMMYFYYSYYFFLFISFFCSCFSFFLFSFVFHGLYHNFYSFSTVTVHEYLMVYIHLLPLIFCIFCINIYF